MRALSLQGALVALWLAALLMLTGGCTSRWAVRGNIDLTGDGTAAPIDKQTNPLIADPWPRPSPEPAGS